jgi:hypothetical protein
VREAVPREVYERVRLELAGTTKDLTEDFRRMVGVKQVDNVEVEVTLQPDDVGLCTMKYLDNMYMSGRCQIQ